MSLVLKNSYLIHVLLKYSNCFWESVSKYSTYFCEIPLKK